MAKITRTEKSILLELAVVAQYGDGLADAWDFADDIPLSGVKNHLVIGSMTRKELATYETNEYGELVIRLTDKGYAIGLKEANRFSSMNEAFNINRQLNR